MTNDIRSPWVWYVIVIVSAAAVGLLVFNDSESPLRAGVVFWFMLVGPGMPWVATMKFYEWTTELTLGIALSLAIDLLVALLLVYAGAYSYQLGLLVLIGIAMAGVLYGALTLRVKRAGPGQMVIPES
jgi:hypothetical protein